MIGAIMTVVALAQAAVPTVMVARKSLTGGFSCEVRGSQGEKLKLSASIIKFQEVSGQLDRVTLGLTAPARSGLSGTYYGTRDFDLFRFSNALDFESKLVGGVERQAHLLLWTPLGSRNGTLNVDAVADRKLQLGSVISTGICDVKIKENIES